VYLKWGTDLLSRFAEDPSSENLARADAWADAALEALLPRIYQGFGAVQLMVRPQSFFLGSIN
jgi:hypothetical protein